MKVVLFTTATALMLKQLVGCDGFQIVSLTSNLQPKFELYGSDSDTDDNGSNGVNEIDVSDLGLTMEDLNAPLPPEMFGLSTSGYESTSRIPDVEDDGCSWTESAGQMEATLTIPGLRGQPAACLAVDYSDPHSIHVTAFGRIVWTAVVRNSYQTDTATFTVGDGPDMVPVIEVSFQKLPGSDRWGGFILQIGENSIL